MAQNEGHDKKYGKDATLVIMALRLALPAYLHTYGIRKVCQINYGRTLSLAAVYDGVHQLEEEGFLERKLLTPEEWKKNIESLIRREIITQEAMPVPERPRHGYRIMGNIIIALNSGRRAGLASAPAPAPA